MAVVPANGSLDESGQAPLLPSSSVASLAVFSVTFLLGLPGNGLVIWVITLKMKRTVNTVWFLHLAVADFVCCLSLPFCIADLALHHRWPFGWLLCKALPSAVILNMFASVLLLTAISIDRCLLVTKPVWCQNHRTVRLASAVCSAIWVLAFLLCCPSFFYRETLQDELGHTRCMNDWETGRHDDYDFDLWGDEDPALWATEGTYDYDLQPRPSYPTVKATGGSTVAPSGVSRHSRMPREAGLRRKGRLVTAAPSALPGTPGVPPTLPTAGTSQFQDQPDDHLLGAGPPSAFVSTTVTRAVLGFLLPFAIMATCYALMAWKMLTRPFAGPRQRALQLILLVVSTFLLCWAPYHVTGLLFLLAGPQSSLHQALLWWDSLSVALAYANSCVNPLLYVFVGRHFRRKACRTVQAAFEGALAEPSLPASSQERRETTTAEEEVDVSVL